MTAAPVDLESRIRARLAEHGIDDPNLSQRIQARLAQHGLGLPAGGDSHSYGEAYDPQGAGPSAPAPETEPRASHEIGEAYGEPGPTPEFGGATSINPVGVPTRVTPTRPAGKTNWAATFAETERQISNNPEPIIPDRERMGRGAALTATYANTGQQILNDAGRAVRNLATGRASLSDVLMNPDPEHGQPGVTEALMARSRFGPVTPEDTAGIQEQAARAEQDYPIQSFLAETATAMTLGNVDPRNLAAMVIAHVPAGVAFESVPVQRMLGAVEARFGPQAGRAVSDIVRGGIGGGSFTGTREAMNPEATPESMTKAVTGGTFLGSGAGAVGAAIHAASPVLASAKGVPRQVQRAARAAEADVSEAARAEYNKAREAGVGQQPIYAKPTPAQAEAQAGAADELLRPPPPPPPTAEDQARKSAEFIQAANAQQADNRRLAGLPPDPSLEPPPAKPTKPAEPPAKEAPEPLPLAEELKRIRVIPDLTSEQRGEAVRAAIQESKARSAVLILKNEARRQASSEPQVVTDRFPTKEETDAAGSGGLENLLQRPTKPQDAPAAGSVQGPLAASARYQGQTRRALIVEARARELPASGTKDDLVQRLTEDDAAKEPTDATRIRADEGRIREAGNGPEGRPGQGGPNLEQPPSQEPSGGARAQEAPAEEVDPYAAMPRRDLIKEARRRGLPADGRADDLRARLATDAPAGDGGGLADHPPGQRGAGEVVAPTEPTAPETGQEQPARNRGGEGRTEVQGAPPEPKSTAPASSPDGMPSPESPRTMGMGKKPAKSEEPESAMGAAAAEELRSGGTGEHFTPQSIGTRAKAIVANVLGRGKAAKEAIDATATLPKLSEAAPDTAEKMIRWGNAKAIRERMPKALLGMVFGDKVKDRANMEHFGDVALELQLRQIRADYQKAGDRDGAANVGTMIGRSKTLKTEGDFQRAIKDGSEFRQQYDRWNSIVTDLSESMHKGLGGTLASRDQLGGFFGLKWLDPEEIDTGAKAAGGTSTRGNLRNIRVKGPTNVMHRTGTAEAYSNDPLDAIDHMIGGNLERTAQKEAIAQGVKEGVFQVLKKGTRPEEDGWVPIQGVEVRAFPKSGQAAESDLWVKKGVESEVRGVAAVDKSWDGFKANNPLTRIQTMLGVDAGAHAMNDLGAIIASPSGKGMAADFARQFPGVNVADTLARLYGKWRDTDSIPAQIRLAEMAQRGSLPPSWKVEGVRVPGLSKAEDASHAFVNGLNTRTRLVLSDFAQELIDNGTMDDTPANRRRMENQLGQYERRLQTPMIRALKDFGLSDFLVAGRAFNKLALRRAGALLGLDQGAVNANSVGAAVTLRLTQTIGAYMTAAILPAALNLWRTGKVAPTGIPLGALATTKNDDGSWNYVDPLKWTMLRRGLRNTGINAMAEGIRAGKSFGQTTEDMTRDILAGFTHPFFGPAVNSPAKLLFGQTPYGAITGQKEEPVRPGQNKFIVRGEGALTEANPTIGAIVKGGAEPGTVADKAKGAASQLGQTFTRIAGLGKGQPPDKAETAADRTRWAKFGEYLDATRAAARRLPAANREAFIRSEAAKLAPDEAGRLWQDVSQHPARWFTP